MGLYGRELRGGDANQPFTWETPMIKHFSRNHLLIERLHACNPRSARLHSGQVSCACYGFEGCYLSALHQWYQQSCERLQRRPQAA